jgi:beta-phosphoglucomutase-like phosphatase (HAD superfamily)
VRAAQNAGMHALVITTTHTPDEFESFDNVIGFAKDFTNLQLAFN